jgi:hypothetical protein
LFFIPQVQSQGFQAGSNVNRPHSLQGRYVVAALLQMIIGDAGTNVMDVMKTDKVSMPQTYPRFLFHRGEAKNEPWVQSWNKMKIRAKRPAATIARVKVIQYEYP